MREEKKKEELDRCSDFSGNSTDNVQESIQDDLNRLFKWMCRNKLSLNTDKTVCMLLGSRNLIANQVPLQFVSELKRD